MFFGTDAFYCFQVQRLQQLFKCYHYRYLWRQFGIVVNAPWIREENEEGQYVFRPFPNEAQIAPVQDCKISDVNNDGELDLILVGNHYDSEVETVRYDAGNGLILLGNKDQSFDPLPVWASRFYVPFNTKDMTIIPNYKGKKSLILTANNNFRVMAYEY